MAKRRDIAAGRVAVAETLPAAIRAQLDEMRSLARPSLDRILAEFDANPTTLLRDLPAVRQALAVDEEDVSLALLAAVMERRLDSDDAVWHTLFSMVYGHVARREELAPLVSDHPVTGAFLGVFTERSQEDRARKLAQQPDPKRTPPLPPHLDERLLGHRGAAEPWLARVDAMQAASREVQEAWMESLHNGELLDRDQMLADAGVEDTKDILRDLKQEPAGLQLSVALACLYDQLNEPPRIGAWGNQLWRDLNRRALPYERDDLELALALLDGHRFSWYYGEQLVRAVERHSARTGAVPESWQDSLRAMLVFAAGNRLAEYQKMAVTIRSLLGMDGPRAGANAATRLDVSAIDGDDAWSSTVRTRLTERYGSDGGLNELLGALQESGTAPRPSAAWRRRIESGLHASDSAVDVVRMLLETAVEVRDELVRRTDSGDWLFSALGEPAALQIRAAAWAAQLSGAAWAPDLVEQLAGRYGELLFNGEPHSARVVDGAVSALALAGDRDAVVRLARLQRAMWHGSLRKHVERELDSLSGDLTRGQLLELSAPDLGLGDDGTCTLPVGTAGSLTLALDERCRLVPRWSTAGSDATTASPPSVVVSAEPERVQELRRLVKQSRASLAAERDRMDGMLAEQPSWSLPEWCASYVAQPVLRAFGRTLVWNVDLGDEVRAGIPGDEAGTFVGVDGARFAAPGDARVTLWHPIGASDSEIAAWRSATFERRLVQAVRQVFREVYRLAPDERGSRHYSNRFAGQLLVHRTLRGLFKRRGWKSPALLVWDVSAPDVAVAGRVFSGFGIRAELRYAPVWTDEALDELGSYQLVGTDQLRFHPAGAKQADALALEDVPALVLSEAMRDVDLFVSACSVALDPAWHDVGDGDFRHRWRTLAFGELVESARVRRDLLQRVLPELSIADRCTLYDRELVVDGSRATYRIHVGTGQVRVDPHGSPLVLPDRRVGGRELATVFLPIEADDTLLAVLGTAFLLANDDAIADPALLAQLPSG